MIEKNNFKNTKNVFQAGGCKEGAKKLGEIRGLKGVVILPDGCDGGEIYLPFQQKLPHTSPDVIECVMDDVLKVDPIVSLSFHDLLKLIIYQMYNYSAKFF